MMQPYIGITDFTTRLEVEHLLDVMKQYSNGKIIRTLGVGVMMTYKTLNHIPSRFNGVFPANEQIADIFISDPLVFNVLHYADYKGIDVMENLIQAVAFGGPNLQAIQLDMIWPVPEIIKEFKKYHPAIKIILQVNPPALDLVENNPSRLVEKLQTYNLSLDGVLLDMSMGQGISMSWSDSLPYLSHINRLLSHINLVVAGGLGPDSLHLVSPLISCFQSEISIDAQGKLRPSGSYFDPIDWSMAEKYLIGAIDMFKKNRP